MATPATDYLLDSNGDLLITNGDIVVGESDKQHIKDTINAFPGWWKQYPTDGVGIAAYAKARANTLELEKQLRLQLESDGYRVGVPIIEFDNGKLHVFPDATRL